MQTTSVDVSTPARETRFPGLAVAALASLGAGAVHAAATGIHAEHPQLARIFVVMTVLQLSVGLWALVRPNRLAAGAVVAGAACTPMTIVMATTPAQIHALMPTTLLGQGAHHDRGRRTFCP